MCGRCTCWFAMLALCCPVVGMSQDEPVAPSDVVTVTFDWQPGMRAQVEARRFQVRARNGVPDTTVTTMTYRMTVTEHARGRLISYSDFGQPDAGLPAMPGTVDATAIAERLGSTMPALLVSDAGELIDVTILESVREETRRQLQPLLDSIAELGAELSAELRYLMDQVLSAEFLRAQAEEDWNALVWMWAGEEYEIGAVYELEVEEPSPLFPDRLIPVVYQFALTDRVPCSAADADTSCVRLTMASWPEATAVRELLTDVLDRIAGQNLTGVVGYESLEAENWVELVTEPSSLRPHAIEVGQAIEMTGAKIGEPTESFMQVRTRSYRFSYEPD